DSFARRGELVRAACRALLALALCATTLRAADAVREIRADNLNEAADLLLPSIRSWVARGDFALRVADLHYSPRWDDAFLAASHANRSRYAVDADGNVVDAQTGERPSYVFGFPFPVIDAADTEAGTKVMWNRWYAVYKRTQVSVPSHIHILGRAGLVRDVEAVTTTLAYTAREGGSLPNP